MIVSRSFVDVLFILLCGTIVMLSQSLRIGSVEAAPARVGAGGVSDVLADDVRPVVVLADALVLDDQRYIDQSRLAAAIAPHQCVLLVAGREDLAHHRMMAVWSDLRERGLSVKFGVKPEAPSTPAKEQ